MCNATNKRTPALAVGLLFAALSFAACARLQAQTEYANFNLTGVQKEINMMETILGELLYPGSQFTGLVRANRIRGVYVPGLGVVFRISPSPSFTGSFYYFQRGTRGSAGKESNIVVVDPSGAYTGRNEAGPAADSSIIAFLENYADASNQLKKDERIIVVYEPQGMISAIRRRLTTGAQTGFALSVKKGDISAYRSRRLSEDRFKRRITRTSLQESRKKHLQLKVFANIIENTLKTFGYPNYALYGDISDLYLDDFGAIFLFDVIQPGGEQHSIFLRLEELRKQNERMARRLREIAKSYAGQKKGERMATEIDEVWSSFTLSDSSRNTRNRQAYQQLERHVLHCIVDYGQSLKLLENDQHLAIAIKIHGASAIVPERVVFKVKKQDLLAYQLKKIDRETMQKRISVKRYGVRN